MKKIKLNKTIYVFLKKVNHKLTRKRKQRIQMIFKLEKKREAETY